VKAGRDDQKALWQSSLRGTTEAAQGRHIESLIEQQSLQLATQPTPGDTRNMEKLIRVDPRHSILLLLPRGDHPIGFPELLRIVLQVVLVDMLTVQTCKSSSRDSILWKMETLEDRCMMQRYYFSSSWMTTKYRAQKIM